MLDAAFPTDHSSSKARSEDCADEWHRVFGCATATGVPVDKSLCQTGPAKRLSARHELIKLAVGLFRWDERLPSNTRLAHRRIGHERCYANLAVGLGKRLGSIRYEALKARCNTLAWFVRTFPGALARHGIELEA